MDADVLSLQEVLAVAKIHPFYNPDKTYPPNNDAVQAAKERAAGESAETNLNSVPLLWKSKLYSVIQRLINDTSAENTYRRSVYSSTTGGGSGSTPLFFATDVDENRRQRRSLGLFLRRIGVVTPDDWVVTVHNSGKLYRSLDLIAEILENAGASVLTAGHLMPASDVVGLLINYHANVLSGDSSQVTHVVNYISTLAPEVREKIHLDKVIYTSEMLTTAQRAYILKVLGPIKICSIMASAETGPWTASNPDLTGAVPVPDAADFIYDTRAMKLEIFPLSCLESDEQTPEPLPDGEQGYVVATSLSRLRHPLVRYVTGDVASIHPLPEHTRAKFSDAEWQHLRILRLRGRDRRLSFDWDGEYIEFSQMRGMLEGEALRLLQWQVILGKVEPSKEALVEIRVLCGSEEKDATAHRELVTRTIEEFFNVNDANSYKFRLILVDSMDEFERSATGRKVIKFIDRFTNQ